MISIAVLVKCVGIITPLPRCPSRGSAELSASVTGDLRPHPALPDVDDMGSTQMTRHFQSLVSGPHQHDNSGTEQPRHLHSKQTDVAISHHDYCTSRLRLCPQEGMRHYCSRL